MVPRGTSRTELAARHSAGRAAGLRLGELCQFSLKPGMCSPLLSPRLRARTLCSAAKPLLVPLFTANICRPPCAEPRPSGSRNPFKRVAATARNATAALREGAPHWRRCARPHSCQWDVRLSFVSPACRKPAGRTNLIGAGAPALPPVKESVDFWLLLTWNENMQCQKLQEA